MRKLKPWVMLGVILFLSVGCVKFSLAAERNLMSQRKSIKNFDSVAINGAFRVQLIGNVPESAQDVRIIGTKRAIQRTQVSVYNHILMINGMGSGGQGKGDLPLLVIRAHRIKNLRVGGRGKFTAIGLNDLAMNVALNMKGDVNLSGYFGVESLKLGGRANIHISGVRNHQMKMVSTGNDRVELSGEVALRDLIVGGNAHIKIFWVKGNHLRVVGKDHAKISLAGNINTLDLRLGDNAHFDGRYLRTKEAFVKTFQFAQADVNVSVAQHSVAVDKSNVYFYHASQFAANYMNDHGAGIDMRGIPQHTP
jgi:Putative auto-transporter adhesin, head GIN domain